MSRYVLLMGLLAFLSGCVRPSPKEGGLYFTKSEKGDYTVLKILKVDDQGVHVRLYSNRYQSPPTKVELSSLYMAGMD